MKYIEKRVLYAEDLRRLCIERNWYTGGTCEEYEGLFAMLRNENFLQREITTEVLSDIAADIAVHSNLDDDWTIPDVMYEVARVCTVTFSEVIA